MTGHAPGAMDAEFDTVAEWTARVALDLGPDYRIPAACRGSGQPAALDWLLAGLAPAPGDALIDVGAGLGGPAAYAAAQASVRPVLLEPEPGACRAAGRLFGFPAYQATATEPSANGSRAASPWKAGKPNSRRAPRQASGSGSSSTGRTLACRAA